MPKVKRSIKKRYAMIFCMLVASLLVVVCLTNALFLNKIYLFHKKNVLLRAYDVIDLSSENDELNTDKFEKMFKKVAAYNNLDILIMDADTRSIKATGRSETLSKRLLDYIFNGAKEAEVIYSKEHLQIQKVRDDEVGSEYLELWGTLSDNNVIVMRTAIESVRDSAIIANEFLIGIGVLTLIIGIIVVLIMSRRITKPIMRLVGISEKITHLDFSDKYENTDKNDEIDLLGEHINELSGALETTISELKSKNVELKQDIEKKNEIEKVRSEFISNVSHELKTPIALISGYAEGLKDCVNDDEESRNFYCDVIMDEAAKMNMLVKNLLTLNELENGVGEIVTQHFNLREVVNNCMESMNMLAKQFEVTMTLTECEDVYVWADDFKIEQVLNNYLSNAIHYASNEKIVKVSILKIDDVARVTVFNSGDNIPNEDIDNLWTKFYKVDKARTRSYGGSGIGLSIVKAIMEQMGKGYGVNNLDDGVEFYFEVDASDSLKIVKE